MTPGKVEAALGVFKDAIRYEVRAEADPGWIAEMREALSVLTEALAERGWRPIESAPEGVDVLVYCKDQEPAIFSARLVNRHPSVGGMYWHPSEALVADAMAEEFNPSHWQPLPEPPHAR